MSFLDLFGEEARELVVPVRPAIDSHVRALCVKPYPLHPKGCPNFGKCDRCPPAAPMFDEAFDISKPVYAIINEFDLASHVSRMKQLHPNWSKRQLYCVLYWQSTARKQLQTKIDLVLNSSSFYEYEATWCPEGMGVNVVKTLNRECIDMEWPPRRVAKQVAFLGIPKRITFV